MQLVQFIKTLRLTEINILDLREGIEKTLDAAVQDKDLFLAKLTECLSADRSLGVDGIGRFLNQFIGAAVESFGSCFQSNFSSE